jgi:hypothetical protein
MVPSLRMASIGTVKTSSTLSARDAVSV